MSVSTLSAAAATITVPAPSSTAATAAKPPPPSSPSIMPKPKPKSHHRQSPDRIDSRQANSDRRAVAPFPLGTSEGAAAHTWPSGATHGSYASEIDTPMDPSSDTYSPHSMSRHTSLIPFHPPLPSLVASSLPPDETTLWLREKFPALPPGDVVIASYACAIVKSILVQGRLYVTHSTLLFYSRIFGRVTKEFYPMTSIRSITPRRSGFVANAVKIKFLDPDTPPVVLGSLSRRERACALINNRLQAFNPALALASVEEYDEENSPDDDDAARSQASAHGLNIRANSLGSIDGGLPPQNGDPSANPTLGRRVSSIGSVPRFTSANATECVLSRDPSEQFSSSDDGSTLGGGDRPRMTDVSEAFLVSSSSPKVRSKSVVTRDPGSKGPTSNGSQSASFWRSPEDPVDRLSGKVYASRVEQARGTLNAPVEQCFDILFRGDWLMDCHSSNGNTEITQTKWERAEDGYMTRTLKFQHALGYRIGPKSTRVVETNKYSFTSAGGVVVELNGHNLDAPFGDHFRVESYIELSPLNHNKETLMVVSVAVFFAKSSMLRSKIESGCIAETKISYSRLVDAAARHVSDVMTRKEEQAVGDEIHPVHQASGIQSPPENATGSAGDPEPVQTQRISEPVGRRCVEAEDAPVIIGETVHVSKASKSSLSSSTVLELQEAPWSRVLRLVALLALTLIVLMLILCVLMLVGLQGDLRRLEELALQRVSAVMDNTASCGNVLQ